MTNDKEKTSTDPSAGSTTRNLLKFTCPKCGSHRLEEVVQMRQVIEGVYDPEDPNYDWYYDASGMVVITKTVYASPSDGNVYRCYDCEAELRDRSGHPFWEAERLYRWLKGMPVDEDDEDEDYDESEE